MLDPNVAWILVISGVILIIIEILIPGQTFLVVPGSFMVTLGAIGFATMDENIVFGPVGLISSLAVTLVVAVFTLYVYRRLGREDIPMTTAGMSLIGKKGVVTKKVIPNSMKGKVMIESMEWSARSDEEIDEGSYVEVVESRGVHVVVEEIEPPPKRSRKKISGEFEEDEEEFELLEDYQDLD